MSRLACTNTTANKLTREEMVKFVGDILNPDESGLTSEQLSKQLMAFCVSCPDPAAAMDIVVETPPPVTAHELVEQALRCPARDPNTVPESELALTHPLRYIRVGE